MFNNTPNTFYLQLYGRREGNDIFNDTPNTFYLWLYGRQEGNVLFNNMSNTFYLQLYGRKEMIYLTTQPTHCICSYMSSDIGKGPLR